MASRLGIHLHFPWFDANLRASQAREASGKVFNVATEKRFVNEVLRRSEKLTGRTEVNAEYLKRDRRRAR